MANEIVFIKRQQALTSSRIVAEVFEKRHSDVIRAIENLLKEEDEDNFNERNFALVKYKDEKGEMRPEYLMTRDGFFLLAMGFTGKKALKFKKEFIRAFNYMEQILTQQQNLEWQNARELGKSTRKEETDIIKELIPYAISQGSEHSNMLYTNYSKLANKAVGIDSSSRDKATVRQLNNLDLVEHIIQETIHRGIEEGLHYKEIYKVCKDTIYEINLKSYNALCR